MLLVKCEDPVDVEPRNHELVRLSDLGRLVLTHARSLAGSPFLVKALCHPDVHEPNLMIDRQRGCTELTYSA